MKKISVIVAVASLALSIPLSVPAMEHDHSSMHTGQAPDDADGNGCPSGGGQAE